MKKGLKIGLILIFLFLLAIAAYYYFNPRRALKVIFPELDKIEKVRIKFKGDTALIVADILLQNNSFFKLNIDSLIYNVKLDTSTLLSKAQVLQIVLKPGEQDTLHLPLALPFKRLTTKIKKLQNQDSTGITLDIRLVYATIFGRTSLPYNKTIPIAVPIPPKLEVEKLEYLERRDHFFYFNAHVKVINMGKLDLELSDIRYSLKVKDNFTASGSEPDNIHISPGSEQIMIVPVKVKFDHLLKTVFRVLTDNDKVKYNLTIKGKIKMDKLDDDKTEIQLEKSGIMELKK